MLKKSKFERVDKFYYKTYSIHIFRHQNQTKTSQSHKFVVISRSMSWLVAHPRIFWLFIKGPKLNSTLVYCLDFTLIKMMFQHEQSPTFWHYYFVRKGGDCIKLVWPSQNISTFKAKIYILSKILST